MNRDANMQNTYPHLTKWCENYHKESGLKIHPSSVPVDLVLDDLMGYIDTLITYAKSNLNAVDKLTTKLATIEADLLESRIEVKQLKNQIEEQKQTKIKVKKNE